MSGEAHLTDFVNKNALLMSKMKTNFFLIYFFRVPNIERCRDRGRDLDPGLKVDPLLHRDVEIRQVRRLPEGTDLTRGNFDDDVYF